MRLSEAIQLGSMLHPQGFGDFKGARLFYASLFGESVACAGTVVTCALGAAFDATSWPQETREVLGDGCVCVGYDFGPFQSVLEKAARCPACDASGCVVSANVRTIIVHLNDDHRWTRERIATEFVAHLEAQYEATHAATAAPVTP